MKNKMTMSRCFHTMAGAPFESVSLPTLGVKSLKRTVMKQVQILTGPPFTASTRGGLETWKNKTKY